jgi:thiol:disulfide interchange protein
MKKILMAIALGCIWLQAQAAEVTWGTDVPKALAQAKTDKKLVLLDFTGSDWCPACILFHKDATKSPAFASFASTNLALVEVDFPQNKTQSDDLKAANAALQKKYDIEGFPTLIVLNAGGKELWRQLGYESGGIDALVKKLEKLSKP